MIFSENRPGFGIMLWPVSGFRIGADAPSGMTAVEFFGKAPI